MATKVTDTIKIVDNEGFIKKTPDRNYLWAAQTPQGFLVDKLKKAHKMAIDKNWKVTDDASLFEMLNWKVKIIEGNIPYRFENSKTFCEELLVKKVYRY